MFPTKTSPQHARLDVYAQVPISLAVHDRAPCWARAELGVSAPLAFLEGPVDDLDGGLFMVDVAWGRILHHGREGIFHVVVEYDGEPNGLVRVDDERLLIADHRRGILALDNPRAPSPRLSVVADNLGGAPFHGLNDLVVGSDGSVYVTDQGNSGLHDPHGRLLRIDADGNQHILVDGIPSPNGLVLDETEETVYLAVTRDNAIWRVPLAATGVQPVGRYLQLSGGIGPDGLAQGPHETLLVAHLGLGVVWVYDSTGVPILSMHHPGLRTTTNLCVDRSGRLYVTESETCMVLTADLGSLLGTNDTRQS